MGSVIAIVCCLTSSTKSFTYRGDVAFCLVVVVLMLLMFTVINLRYKYTYMEEMLGSIAGTFVSVLLLLMLLLMFTY